MSEGGIVQGGTVRFPSLILIVSVSVNVANSLAYDLDRSDTLCQWWINSCFWTKVHQIWVACREVPVD